MLNLYLLLFIFAGIINASFVVPKKYIRTISNEKVWMWHSIFGLMLIPWTILFLTFPHALEYYFALKGIYFAFLITCGAIFGLGQVCFAYALERIGIALGFTINLGIGVLLGSLFVVFYHEVFFTRQGFLVVLSIGLIIASLTLHYFAHKNNNQHINITNYHRGWLLASIAGITSGLQNICFVVLISHASAQAQNSNLFWVWPPFLSAAALFMLWGFTHKMQHSSLANQIQTTSITIKNVFLIIAMGLFFTGSLALYSLGMSKATQAQQIIGWPTFMVSIIFTSQALGWLYKELRTHETKRKLLNLCSIFLLITAIGLLSIASM